MHNSENNLKEAVSAVILKEAKAINNLLGSVDNNLIRIIELIAGCKGRLVVSGVGKSAIVANKIVATCNSTGTPSLFMHSADAVHGDMGMIGRDDIVLFISKSGDTPELQKLLPFIRQKGNIVISMVSNKHSYLSTHSDYIIYVPIESEACHNNLAPSSSTTAHIVMGDAIALAVSKLKNFTPEDFAKNHPGGSLGKRLYMCVADVFDKTNRPLVTENESIQNTIITISSHRLGATVVLGKNEELKGIITDGDVRRMLERGVPINTLVAKDIMSSSPKTIDINELAVEAFKMMERYQITSIVVLEKGRYVGLIHIHDILREGIS